MRTLWELVMANNVFSIEEFPLHGNMDSRHSWHRRIVAAATGHDAVIVSERIRADLEPHMVGDRLYVDGVFGVWRVVFEDVPEWFIVGADEVDKFTIGWSSGGLFTTSSTTFTIPSGSSTTFATTSGSFSYDPSWYFDPAYDPTPTAKKKRPTGAKK